MKKSIQILLFFGFMLTGCSDPVYETIKYSINEPVFMDATEFRNSVKVTGEIRTIEKQGKISFYQDYLYISEPEKGIHIIDNRNPASPKNIGFIELLGNADISIRNNQLYADAFIDLVWFDVSNPAKPELKGRLENVFTNALPATENNDRIDYGMVNETITNPQKIVVGWQQVNRIENIQRQSNRWDWFLFTNSSDMMLESTGGSSNSVNGSMSRFTIYQDNLYAVLNNNMHIFDLTADTPVKAAEDIYVGWDVETIFSYKTNMFLGTPRGLIIFSVEDPLQPTYVSSIQHVFGCDPVVVEDDIAWVTIRSGTNCGQNSDELIVIDVQDVKHPRQLVSYSMKNPKGLGIDNGKLFLCDDGLQILRSDEPMTIMANKLAHYEGMDGFDVIAYNGILMMIADNGLYQYDYSDIENIVFLSKLDIGG